MKGANQHEIVLPLGRRGGRGVYSLIVSVSPDADGWSVDFTSAWGEKREKGVFASLTPEEIVDVDYDDFEADELIFGEEGVGAHRSDYKKIQRFVEKQLEEGALLRAYYPARLRQLWSAPEDVYEEHLQRARDQRVDGLGGIVTRSGIFGRWR